MAEDVVKVTFNLPESELNTLKRLASANNTTVTSILRSAIALEDYVQGEKQQGGKILVEKSDKTVREVVFRR